MAVEGRCLMVSSLPEPSANKHIKIAAFSHPRRSMPRGAQIGGTQAEISPRGIEAPSSWGIRSTQMVNPNFREILFRYINSIRVLGVRE
uniref:Uncharacterized protein n=1 Tax=Arundo donax TaxID=35708 RepID=A0A0A8Y0G5_ARUDO